MKETYPRYKFSVTRRNYRSIGIFLIRADFEAFSKESKYTHSRQLNHYHIEDDTNLTDRAREVMDNVYHFVSSYNFDDSDVMTDYFHCNFYLDMGIGTSEKPYKIEVPKLKAERGSLPPVFKHPEGSAHKAIRQALGKARFGSIDSKRYNGVIVLGEDSYGDKGEHYFWPLRYSSEKTAQKRIDKLLKSGIISRTTGYNGGYIEFIGYKPETEALLEKERTEWLEAKKAWDEKQKQKENTITEGAERLSSPL